MTSRRASTISRSTAAVLAGLIAAAAGVAGAVADEPPAAFALRVGTVYTMAPGEAGSKGSTPVVISNCLILIENGRISAVGSNIEVPSFVDVIDLPDAVAMPGLVAADSSIAGRNASEDSVGPRYRAVDAFNPFADYSRVLAGGVTTAYLNPGRHRLMSGRGAVVKLGAGPGAPPLVEAERLVINLGEGAFNPPPKQNWLIPPSSDNVIIPATVQRPSSRLGQFLQLRESFDAARAYAERLRAGAAEKPEYDDNLDALAAALAGQAGVRINADRATDIEQALAFCRERKLKPVLAGLREGHRLARLIREAGAPMVVEIPIYPTAGNVPNLGLNPDQLEDRPGLSGLAGGGPLAVRQPEGAPLAELSMHAAAAMRYGLTREQALRAITIDAAEVLGVAKRVGSIAPGKDADLLILNGEPLAVTTHVRRVYVNGRLAFDADGLTRPKPREKARPAPLVVKAGTVWTGDATFQNGAVLIEDGRIVAAGQTVPVPPRARVVDAGPRAVITPGFIDARGHLGLEGDRTRAEADLSPAKALARAESDFARVAAAGVTTVMTASYTPGTRGARVSAIHTAGADRSELVVKETAAILLPLRGSDPTAAPNLLRETIRAAKTYDEAWKKYEKALEEYKAKGPQAAAPPPESKPDEVTEEKPKADPITGTWEGKISGGPIPEPQDFRLKMKLSGEQVTGSVGTFMRGGEEAEVTGTFRDGHLSLEMVLPDSPFGNPKIEADIDREDHLTGQLRIAQFAFDVEASRIEKEAPEIKVTIRRGKKKDGKPEAPKRNEALEPYRALLAGRAALVLDVDHPAVIEAILPVLTKESPVPFALLNAEGAGPVMSQIAGAKTGVILPVDAVRRIAGRDTVQAVEMSRAGVPVAFQSDAEDGARALPDRAAYAVRLGLDATAALRGLTVDAARMLKCDDQVGVLRPGARGDVLIFNGPPLEPGTRLERVFIDGQEVRP